MPAPGGKVAYSWGCVPALEGLSGPGVCLVWGGVCSRGCLVWGGSAPGGVYAPGGTCSGGCLVETPRTATAAGGTHPTGMHSCLVTFVEKGYLG